MRGLKCTVGYTAHSGTQRPKNQNVSFMSTPDIIPKGISVLHIISQHVVHILTEILKPSSAAVLNS
jgi:hypothetical protein